MQIADPETGLVFGFSGLCNEPHAQKGKPSEGFRRFYGFHWLRTRRYFGVSGTFV